MSRPQPPGGTATPPPPADENSHSPGSHPLTGLWRLDQRYAVVTGASRGIGYAVAEQLLERGAHVLLVARGPAALENARANLAQRYGTQRVTVCAADLAQNTGCAAVRAASAQAFPRLDILVNNVGTNIRKAALAYSQEEYRQIFDTNLYSAFELSRQLHPQLQQGRQPAVVNVASVAGLTHLRTGAPYAMTKAAMIQLTRNLAVEWAAAGIRVNAIAPWYIDTPLAAQVLEDADYLAQVLTRTPLQRIGTRAEAAAAAVFLALPAAGFVTGQTLAVDGGFTIYGF